VSVIQIESFVLNTCIYLRVNAENARHVRRDDDERQ